MLERAKTLFDIFWKPVPDEVRSNLKMAWEGLSAEMHTPRQMYGTHGYNCGALIGAMPRCDFACKGCYLGEEANQIPALPLEEVKAQIRAMRPFLGPLGNLQLTDGEITLRPEHELIELVRYSREVGLLPMLMTHGDTFRRRPGLLEKLMQAGLREVSIHVDTDMRGRKGEAYKRATREEELHPLRDEFAKILREARKSTGLKIASATTMTVTAENLSGVPTVMQWLLHNPDAFKMISFQPIAQVGRTEEGLGGGVAVEELWQKIAEGLYGPGADPQRLLRGAMWMGHKACNRYVLGTVLSRPGREPYFDPACNFEDRYDEEIFEGLRRHYGGISFRADYGPEAIARVLGCFKDAPRFFLSLFPWVWSRVKRLDPEQPGKLLLELLRGEARLSGLNIVSHHFMSRQELETPLGQERLSMCMFKLPVGDRYVSMCETNALGVREQFYESIRERFPRKKPTAEQPAGAEAPAAE